MREAIRPISDENENLQDRYLPLNHENMKKIKILALNGDGTVDLCIEYMEYFQL